MSTQPQPAYTIEQALQLAMAENETTEVEWSTVKPYPFSSRAKLCKVDVTGLYTKQIDPYLRLRLKR